MFVQGNVQRDLYLGEEQNVYQNALVWSNQHPSPARVAQVAGARLELGSTEGQGSERNWLHRGLGARADSVRVAPDIRVIICAPQWDWSCEWAIGIVYGNEWCPNGESGGDPNAMNPAGPYVGIWQVLNGSTDPWENTRQAHRQYLEWVDGWRTESPWPGCALIRP